MQQQDARRLGRGDERRSDDGMSAAARRLGFALAAAGLVLAGLVAGSLVGPGGDLAAARSWRRHVAAAGAAVGTAPGAADAGALPPGTSLVANVRGTRPLAIYRRPGAARPARRLAGPAARVYLVRERRRTAGCACCCRCVRTARAAGSVRGASSCDANPYRIDVRLRAHRLRCVVAIARCCARRSASVARSRRRRAGSRTSRACCASRDPHGTYGPWAFGLSVYSPVLTSFGGGPGEVGIHGTNAPAGIGRDVSHGCIRLPNAAIERLARVLPLGTPVRIA